MGDAFNLCNNIRKIPVIPSNVSNMDWTFANCKNLEEIEQINANPTSYTNCFKGASTDISDYLILKGESNNLQELLNTKSSSSCIRGSWEMK